MSTDERNTEIGRMATRRQEAKQEKAILSQRIKDTGRALYELGGLLIREYQDQTGMEEAASSIKGHNGSGTFERLQKDIVEWLRLEQRISELTQHLREAGIE